jgi:RHS repeat-associated protein
MKRFSTLIKSIILIAVMLSFGLSTAQAKDRISYFHSDISGSPIAATNDSGDVLWEETYKPYGERLNTDNSNKANNNQWFTGKQEEADLGLQYFGARWYHQASGRFISRDPAGVLAHVENNPMMFNRYAYGNNNPYRYVDTDGRFPFLIPLAIFIAKEIASEAVEQVVGIPMPTVKNGLKYAIKQGNKQIAKEGMKQAAKVVKATSKKVTKGAPKYARNKYKSVTRTEKKRVLGENKTCVYCEKNPSTQVDHIRAQKQDWVEGGFKDSREVRSARVNDPSNLTGSCQSCNASKGSKPLGSGEGHWTPPKDR